jgi:hypothetical protein
MRAGLITVLGLGLGHVVAVSQYQADRLQTAALLHGLQPRNFAVEQTLLARNALAVAVAVALVCAAVLAARRLAEAAVMLLAGYSALGVVVSIEQAVLGYDKGQWPLMPWAQRHSAGAMIAIFVALLAASAVAVWREALAQRGRRRRRPRRPSELGPDRGKHRAAADRDEEGHERAGPED